MNFDFVHGICYEKYPFYQTPALLKFECLVEICSNYALDVKIQKCAKKIEIKTLQRLEILTNVDQK